MIENPKISVIIPVYNVEKFLEETIKSVIYQTLDFKKNIEMIIVNDGSPDNSEKICLKYQKQYPENIRYIKQENAGVSAARNNGLKYARGEYVNFLDSDDKWSSDSFEKAMAFFNKHKDVNILAFRMKFFDASKAYHQLDYKFTGDKVINVKSSPDSIVMHVTSTVIKTEIARAIEFNPNIKYGEDSTYLNTLILAQQKYGIVSSSLFMHRIRPDNSSAVQNKEKNISWYTDTIEYSYKFLISKSQQKYGYVPKYVQMYIMYDLKYRLMSSIPEEFGITEKYISDIKWLLKHINDEVICSPRISLSAEYKLYALLLKYDNDLRGALSFSENRLYYKDLQVFNFKYKGFMTMMFLYIEDGKIHFEGNFNCGVLDDSIRYYMKRGSEPRVLVDAKTSNINVKYSLDGILKTNEYFSMDIPLEEGDYNFFCQYKNNFIKLNILFDKYAKLDNGLKNSYYYKDGYMITPSESGFVVKKAESCRKQERAFRKEIRKDFHFQTSVLRWMVDKKLKSSKKHWLVYDKFDKADDNAEHLFKYLQENPVKNTKVYFVLSKSSPDYERLSKIGKIVEPKSRLHRYLHFSAEKIISSHATEGVINPFPKIQRYFKDKMRRNYFFIQHGIITHDHSYQFNRLTKNLAMFVTSTEKEYQSILEFGYGYDSKAVQLTGLPRYDRLYGYRNLPTNKEIILLPTWRKELTETYNHVSYKSVYSSNFKKTDFYAFYNGILTNERLQNALREHGYTIRMCLHPIMSEQWRDFKENDVVKVNKGYVDYSEMLRNGSVLVTDYSSINFDFAYTLKPVIYAEFDKERFFLKQGYDTCPLFENEELGPVCNNADELVDCLIKYLNNDCKFESQYLEKINSCFKYCDTDNCKRVVESVKSICWE